MKAVKTNVCMWQSNLLLCLRYCDCVLSSDVNSCTSLCSLSAPPLTKDASREAMV